MSNRCLGIDREFERLLEEIFGVEFISLFKARRPAGWVDLMIAFESRKRAADPNKDQPLNVSLPFSLIDFHKKHFVSSQCHDKHFSSICKSAFYHRPIWPSDTLSRP